jgi:wobble nucleotide-excising tRNase
VQTPGNVITLQSSESLIQKINKLIEEANEKIVKYNDSIDKPKKVNNIDAIFWRYAVSQFEGNK